MPVWWDICVFPGYTHDVFSFYTFASGLCHIGIHLNKVSAMVMVRLNHNCNIKLLDVSITIGYYMSYVGSVSSAIERLFSFESNIIVVFLNTTIIK